MYLRKLAVYLYLKPFSNFRFVLKSAHLFQGNIDSSSQGASPPIGQERRRFWNMKILIGYRKGIVHPPASEILWKMQCFCLEHPNPPASTLSMPWSIGPSRNGPAAQRVDGGASLHTLRGCRT